MTHRDRTTAEESLRSFRCRQILDADAVAIAVPRIRAFGLRPGAPWYAGVCRNVQPILVHRVPSAVFDDEIRRLVPGDTHVELVDAKHSRLELEAIRAWAWRSPFSSRMVAASIAVDGSCVVIAVAGDVAQAQLWFDERTSPVAVEGWTYR